MCVHNNCETVIYLLEVIILSKPHIGPCLAIAQLGRLEHCPCSSIQAWEGNRVIYQNMSDLAAIGGNMSPYILLVSDYFCLPIMLL